MTMRKMLIVGYGNMASAMLEGWLRAGYHPQQFTIYHPRGAEAPEGVEVVTEWPQAGFDAIIVGVKPHQLDEVSPGVAQALDAETIVISILAGTTLAQLERTLPGAGGWVRLMPNLACALGKSPNALASQGLTQDGSAFVTELAAALGSAEWLEDERQFDLVTALAGSGPGFVYRFIDALSAGAGELGLEPGQAKRLAVQMVEGAAALAAASPHDPGELARRVASPGGMTQKGLDVLDQGEVLQRLLTETLRKTRDRGREMAENAAKQG